MFCGSVIKVSDSLKFVDFNRITQLITREVVDYKGPLSYLGHPRIRGLDHSPTGGSSVPALRAALGADTSVRYQLLSRPVVYRSKLSRKITYFVWISWKSYDRTMDRLLYLLLGVALVSIAQGKRRIIIIYRIIISEYNFIWIFYYLV